MKTKKILSLVLSFAMLLIMATTVNAQRLINNGERANVTVTYGADMAFIVTIPASVSINAVGIGTATITASDVLIPVGRNLEVRVSGDDYVDNWELINQSDATNKLRYFIYKESDEIINNSLVMSVAPGEAYNSSKSTTLTFSVDGAPSTADSYVDTLTFRAGLSAAIVEFTVTLPYDGGTKTYQTVDGWTWHDWIASDYNTDGYYAEYSQYDGKYQILYEVNDSRWYVVISNTDYDKVFSNDIISRNHDYFTNR